MSRRGRVAVLGGLAAGRAPDQLPLLSRGAHARPEDGACVMEYVSVLTGGRFSDHPRCTHPAVAALARLVNDRIVDDEIRRELALLAPDLADIGRRDPRMTPCVVAGCVRAVAAPAPMRSAQRRLERLQRGGVGGFVARCGELVNPAHIAVDAAFEQVIHHLTPLPKGEQDTRLRDLLRDTVADCRRLRAQRGAVEPAASSRPQ